jgi:hypothetical protein
LERVNIVKAYNDIATFPASSVVSLFIKKKEYYSRNWCGKITSTYPGYTVYAGTIGGMCFEMTYEFGDMSVAKMEMERLSKQIFGK